MKIDFVKKCNCKYILNERKENEKTMKLFIWMVIPDGRKKLKIGMGQLKSVPLTINDAINVPAK